MNAKKSGLADSPFFRPTEPATPPPQPETVPMPTVERVVESVPVYTDTQLHERTPTQMHNRVDAHSHERADAQLHPRTTEQSHGHTITHVNASTNPRLHELAATKPSRP